MVKEKCDLGQAAIILTIPPANLGMKAQSTFYDTCQDYTFPRPLFKQGLVLCLWVNSQYWRLRPPPSDVEEVLHAWVMNACCTPESVTLHSEIIAAIFPKHLRSSVERADMFVEPLQVLT